VVPLRELGAALSAVTLSVASSWAAEVAERCPSAEMFRTSGQQRPGDLQDAVAHESFLVRLQCFIHECFLS
jgi:hypothetical protein